MLPRNTLRKIKKSLGRYLSLLIIILLGVGFYTGITESVPKIKETQINYYEDMSLADMKILSTLGFDDEDIKALKLTGVKKAIGTYSKDVLVKENIIRVHSIETEMNKIDIIKGKTPSKDNECLADANYYKVGDTIKINEKYKENLKNTEYKVVGTIRSPIYTSDDYGSSKIGNGKLHSFIYIPKENFDYKYYTEAFLIVDKNSRDVAYSEGYNLKIEKITEQLQVVKNERLTERIDEIIRNSNGTISNKDLRHNTWHVLNRNDFVSSYAILESQYDQVMAIANVIPIFFILIVALMTSNTMARMITEERSEMGTLLSLGYSSETITNNYLLYVLSATIIGAITGYFIGTICLPRLVYNCFPLNFPNITYTFRLPLLLISLLISSLLMIIVTVFTCNNVLKDTPAKLLRPEPPKSGKKVFLEKITAIWNKLSFSFKLTIRNIARSKRRVLITLIAAAGCTFMIMIGLALKDSINTVGNKQYNDIIKYDNSITLTQSVESIDNELSTKLKGLVKDELLINQTAYKVVDEENSLNVYMIMSQSNKDMFYKYFTLQNPTSKKKLKLTNDGVIITPKIQERFNVKVGDTITIKSLNQEEYKVKVTGITENYVSNYIYISKDLYEQIFKEKPTYNTIISTNIKSKDKIASELFKTKEIMNITFTKDIQETANKAVGGLNNIVILLVVISSILALTVLYNLTSINISERKKEIAILKVLGYTDKEANQYIYRETIITVIVGIVIGLLITPPLHNMVMKLLEVDTMVFLRQIKVQSYIYASLLTLVFAIIMQVITYYKVKEVDMIAPLKSVE